jgi:hypothetical protein
MQFPRGDYKSLTIRQQAVNAPGVESRLLQPKQESLMNPNRKTPLRALAAVPLTALAALAAPASAEPPRIGFHMMLKAGPGAPEDVVVRWGADCAQDASGTYAKAASIASTLQLNASQQALLNAYVAVFCTRPEPPTGDPSAMDVDTRLTHIAQHLETEAQKLRGQADQYRKFFASLSVAQQLIFRDEVAGFPPF